MNHASYFKEYREALGFSSQSQAKTYLSAKDVTSRIDYKYIDNLIVRLVDIVKRSTQQSTPMLVDPTFVNSLSRLLTLHMESSRIQAYYLALTIKAVGPRKFCFRGCVDMS